jgi:diacylglycerol kinase
MVHLRTLKNSFRYAWNGIRSILAQEQNFRIQVALSIVVVIAMIAFQVRLSEAVVLILVIMFVLILEILNTVVEYFIDLLQPRLHHYSKVIKDMMAAAVLISAIGAFIIGVLIFYPYLVEIFYYYGIL